MGNRAVITFESNPTPNSVGVYLHWNGGPESVLAFVQACDELKVPVGDDYELARFVQIVGNFFGGVLSLGVGPLSRLDCRNGDNGVYSVSRIADGEPVLLQSPTGNLDGPWVHHTNAEIRKHAYWTGETPILAEVLKHNHEPFNRG